MAKDPECRSQLRQNSAFFIVPGAKIFRKKTDPGSLFIFCSSKSLRGLHTIHVISAVKVLLNFACIDDFPSLNRSRILKFQKNCSDPDSKILEQEQSRSLKK